MGYFWLGHRVGSYDRADARFQGGRIYLGPEIGPMEAADARFMDGRVWLGPRVGRYEAADASYQGGYIFRGPQVLPVQEAAARYLGGYVFEGPHERAFGDAKGRWEGTEEGLAGAVLLLLLEGSAAPEDGLHSSAHAEARSIEVSRKDRRGCALGGRLETSTADAVASELRST